MYKRMLCFTLILSITLSFNVYAEEEQTTSALIALYNNSVYVPSQEEMDELQRQLADYNAMVRKNDQIKAYNDSVAASEDQMHVLVKEINRQLDEVLADANGCSRYITNNIYDDINVLIEKDSEYKSRIRYANTLMSEVNKYTTSTRLLTLDNDIIERRQEIDEMQEELTMPDIQVVEGEFLLGEVYRCKSPADQPYKVNSEWGARLSPLTGTSIEYHNGIDLYAPEGTEVYALFHGRVLEAGDNWALGNYIRIQHGPGVISVYGHLQDMYVKSGEYVKQYQLIGTSGNTGNRTSGAHLHLGLFINGQSVDPNVLLKNAGRVGQ